MEERYIVTLIFDDGEKQVRIYKNRDDAVKCHEDYTYIVDCCISASIRIENEQQ